MSIGKKRRSTGRVTLADVAQLAGVGTMTVRWPGAGPDSNGSSVVNITLTGLPANYTDAAVACAFLPLDHVQPLEAEALLVGAAGGSLYPCSFLS